MELLAYLSDWSVVAGAGLDVMASGPPSELSCEVLRRTKGEWAPVAAEIELHEPLQPRPLRCGSGFVSGSPLEPESEQGFGFSLWITPTWPARGHRQVLAMHAEGAHGWRLFLESDGRPLLVVGDGSVVTPIHGPQPLQTDQWVRLLLRVDAASRSATLECACPSAFRLAPEAMWSVERPIAGFSPARAQPLCLGVDESGRPGPYAGAFNGRLAEPTWWRQLGAVAVGWDLGVDTEDVWSGPAAGPDGLPMAGSVRQPLTQQAPLRLIPRNAPKRLLPGPRWGAEVDFAEHASLWNAAGCNEDALDDAAWPVAARLGIPHDAVPGVYAIVLQSGSSRYWCPFFVRASGPREKVCVLAPTFTYLAYANHRQASESINFPDYRDVVDRALSLDPIDQWLTEVRGVGPSLYDRYVDGTQVVFSSRRRPIPQMQPHWRWWMTGRARHFAADLQLFDWLEAQRLSYDVLTDEDLDREGGDSLQTCEILITGSHPEYVSPRELVAIERFVASGGTLAYLGGNGFYWVTEIDDRSPHRIEVRRRAHASGTWDANAGEHHLATSREPGGLWADRGWRAEALLGVRFAAQGWLGRRSFVFYELPAEDPVSWLLETLPPGDGNRQLLFDAAGDEWDSVPDLRTAREEVTIIARDEPHPDRPAPAAHMAVVRHAGGGLVFSAGSIEFCSALRTEAATALLRRLVDHARRQVASRGAST